MRMQRLFRFWAVCLLVLGSLTSMAQTTKLTPKVVLFGDDIILGEYEGLRPNEKLSFLLEEKFKAEGADISIVNAGKAGDNAQMALQRMQQEVVTKRPDVVVILFGINDAFVDPGQFKARISLNTYREQLVQMVRFLKQVNITPILLSPPPLGKFLPEDTEKGFNREPYASAGPNFLMDPYVSACMEMAKSEQLITVDLYNEWKKKETEGKTLSDLRVQDYLPNGEGMKAIVDQLFPVLKDEVLPSYTDVFIAGEEGYDTYRIPVLYTLKNGFLMAFAEGRKSKSDHAANDIVMKRSFDHGRTWQKLQIVADDGENSLNNPQVLQMSESGKIMMMYQRYPKGFHEKEVVPGVKGPKVCTNHIVYSEDAGKTWSEPEDITKDTKRNKVVTSIAGGPGVGIQLKNEKYVGRIVMPFNQGPYGDWKVYSVYTDNQGKSWKMGDVAESNSKGMANEVQMVELNDGRIMLNARSQGGNNMRKIAFSEDGGKSWSPLQDDSTLVDPECMGSIIKYNEFYMLFSNPASQDSRTNGTVRLSMDEGKTWPFSKMIYKDSFGYSCLSKLQTNYIGLLFEKDDYEKISFARIPLKWMFSK